VGTFTVILPSGIEWTPSFVDAIDQEKCIGCGRCFKVCLRRVLQLRGVNEDGELIDEDDEDDEEYERRVMTIARPEHCIGCQACSTVCSRKCISHEPLAAAG
jgi:Nif-specific ferredoxin III